MYERVFGFVAICLALLFFWSPILVSILGLILIIIYIKFDYLRNKKITDNVHRKNRQKSNQLMTSDNRFGSNVRPIKTARRTMTFRNHSNADNYPLSYLTEPLNAKYFQQSDSLLASNSGISLGSRTQSPQDLSYSFGHQYQRQSVSPALQLGEIPFVRLSSSASESYPRELKPKISPVRPVTVRIAPMPQNHIKLQLSRLSNLSANTGPTLGANNANESSMQTKAVVDALKKSLRRKREPKNDFESEDNQIISANKKQKRETNDSPITSNGFIPSKQSIKRQANEAPALDTTKKFKNNEIFSSFSSTPILSQSLKNKRKLSPESKHSQDSKVMKSSPKEPEVIPIINANNDINFIDKTLTFDFIGKSEQKKPPFIEESAPKRAYGLPLHLHSMEDHERDRNKTKHRLNRFLNAVKEATSPKKEEPSSRLTTTIEAVSATESEDLLPSGVNKVSEVSESQTTSEIGLPAVPAAAIFTNSRVETSVTTTLLNTPISSVLTTNKESVTPSMSPQMNMSADNNTTNSAVNPINATNTSNSFNPLSNPINSVLPESSSVNPLTNWPSNPLFTAKPQIQPSLQPQSNMLFSVGTGGTTTRRIAQNSRLRTRQRR